VNNDDLSKAKQLATDLGPQNAGDRRMKAAQEVPFVIRAWWLREFIGEQPMSWRDDLIATSIWSNYSDPICDTGGVEEFDDF
jgi:hypothetical protein